MAWHARGQGFKSPQLHPRSKALCAVDRPQIARPGQQVGSNRRCPGRSVAHWSVTPAVLAGVVSWSDLPDAIARCLQAVRSDSKPPPPQLSGRGLRRAKPLTCGSYSPTATARARRGPAVPDAVRTQHGPGRGAPRAWEALSGCSLFGSNTGQGPQTVTGVDRWRPLQTAASGTAGARAEGRTRLSLRRWRQLDCRATGMLREHLPSRQPTEASPRLAGQLGVVAG
jgi:hypothetical protein